MRKKILAFLLCIMLCGALGITALATGDIGIIGGEDGETDIILSDDYLYDDELLYDFDDSYYSEYYSFYDDEEFMEEVNNSLILSALLEDEETMQILYSMGIDKVKSFITCIVVGMIFGLLFVPVLIVMIIFAVLNSKAKKKIKEYEMRMNPAFSTGFVPFNNANLNYQPQPAPQPQVNQAPVVNAEGGEQK